MQVRCPTSFEGRPVREALHGQPVTFRLSADPELARTPSRLLSVSMALGASALAVAASRV